MAGPKPPKKAKSTHPTVASVVTDRKLIADDIEKYLKVHEQKKLLKFLTCGSVDDGKSTLIGRLLHDTDMVNTDHLEALERDSLRAGKSADDLDLSLLVDGLQAEREQGITIDVAYRYFSTAERKFIIADCPGHQQYTRNMATGASNCDLAVILIDAEHGIQEQTKQHTYVAKLLGLEHVVIAVNKMDLVGFDQAVFDSIRTEFSEYLEHLGLESVQFLPMSAKLGDNVVTPSSNMPWYQGETLLALLHSFPITQHRDFESFRMVVQRVNHPDATFRGYSGSLASGVVRKGQPIAVLPSGNQSTIDRIVTMEGDLEEAFAPMAVTVTLKDELDVSRGDVLVDLDHSLMYDDQFEASLVWMDEAELNLSRKYVVKHGASQVLGQVSEIHHRVRITDLSKESVNQLQKNDIGQCKLVLDHAICFDAYARNRMLGGFILIDRLTNRTVAAGMIEPSEEGDMRGQLARSNLTSVCNTKQIASQITTHPSASRCVPTHLYRSQSVS